MYVNTVIFIRDITIYGTTERILWWQTFLENFRFGIDGNPLFFINSFPENRFEQNI
jgi:hypothetical protein